MRRALASLSPPGKSSGRTQQLRKRETLFLSLLLNFMRATGVFADEDDEKENDGVVDATKLPFSFLPPPPPQPPACTSSSSSFSLPDPSRLRPLPRDLVSWGVPAPISKAYQEKCGVSLLHEWQAAALREAVAGNCFVFAAPTSGGKSLVAEVLLVRQLLRARAEVAAGAEAGRRAASGGGGNGAAPPVQRRRRAVVALPYAALVAEKARHLASVLGGQGGLSVKGYWAGSNAEATTAATAATAPGGSGTNASPVGVGGRGAPFNASHPAGSPQALLGEDVAVCTPEKLNGCLSALAAQGRLGEICCVVVDEAHFVSDPSRGPALEIAVAKLLHSHFGTPSRGPTLRTRRPDPRRLQLVAMSATAARLPRLASWLGDARLFVTDERPVPLLEFVADASTGEVFRKLTVGSRGVGIDPAPLRTLRAPRPAGAGGAPSSTTLPAAASRGDGAALVALVAEAFAAGEPTLVFSGSRARAEGAARMLSLALPVVLPAATPEARGSEGKTLRLRRLRAAAVERLRELTAGAGNPLLERALLAGCAWHHAGLSSGERSAVEAAFRDGAVLALSATSTLAAGVNLPAARVVVRSVGQAGGGGDGGGGGASGASSGPLLLSRSQYLQMAGRAGRAGMALRGEAFLLIDPGERAAAAALLAAPLPPVESRLLALASSTAASAKAEGEREREQQLEQQQRQQRQKQQQPRLPSAAAPLAAPPLGFVTASSAAALAAAAPPRQQQPGARDERSDGGEDPLERLMLEAIACGSVRSSEDAAALVECTLARTEEEEEEEEEAKGLGEGCGGQRGSDERGQMTSSSRSSSSSSAVVAAAFDALRRLRERRLVSLRSGPVVAVAKEEEEAEAKEGEEGGGNARSRGKEQPLSSCPPPPPPPPPTIALFAPTTRGAAVAAACLPTSEGERMHDELEALFSHPMPLDSLIPLIFGVLPSSPGGNGSGFPAFTVRNWSAWERAMSKRLSARSLRAAEALGVTREHAAGRARRGVDSYSSAASAASASSYLSSSSLDGRHHRFVAAAVAAALLEEESPEAVSARWESVVVSALGADAAVAAAAEAADLGGGGAKPSAPSPAPAPASAAPFPPTAIPLGEFQRLQAEVSQRAALGAALAAAAGWGHGAALLASVSDRAAASGGGGAAGGARPELLPQLSALPPPRLDARAARALFDAGITDVGKVARAAEERLARAFLSRVRAPGGGPRRQQQQQQNSYNKRPLGPGSAAAPPPPLNEPGAAWSRWATRAAKAAKEAAQKKVKQEERVREELARAAEAEGEALFG